ncbi:hypothetical protein FDP41_007637 [Naegleria fowleri]|uniref:Uncharacterized protein n=1 Tax=Naegleria fowleri TaxID=5763 RepID=A0A6A5C9S0_NAEFO|nr:uncharacterized protein FDP41_007637 [Naegleria fowleri]KAF0983722.1 hypothetical protein FDP41_007637 [Naegleria fowleri]CAG4716837.1 unnamed protein product [Naegleria fowleri]
MSKTDQSATKKRKAALEEDAAAEPHTENHHSLRKSSSTKKKKKDDSREQPTTQVTATVVEFSEQELKQLGHVVDEFFEYNRVVLHQMVTVSELLNRLEYYPAYSEFMKSHFEYREYQEKKKPIRSVVSGIVKAAVHRIASSFKQKDVVSKLYPEEFDHSLFFVKRRVRMTYPLYDYGGIYQTHMALTSGSEFLLSSEEKQEKKSEQTEMEKLIEKQLFDRVFHLVDGYDVKLRGFVMGVENVKILEEGSVIQFETNPSVASVCIAATFILFAPTFGTVLRGTITGINTAKKQAYCKVLGLFNCSVSVPNVSILHELVSGQHIQFHVTYCGSDRGDLKLEGIMFEEDGIVQEEKAAREEPKTVEEEFRFDENELPFQ